jgi:hypothetical protein
MHVTASGLGLGPGGLDATMRTNLLFRGPSPYYPVGTLDVRKEGDVRFDVTVDDPPRFGRLVHTDSKAFLDEIAASLEDPDRQTIPLKDACGRYVDWYELGPGTPAAAIAGVPGPTPQEVAED